MDFISQYFIEILVLVIIVAILIFVAIFKKPVSHPIQEEEKAKEEKKEKKEKEVVKEEIKEDNLPPKKTKTITEVKEPKKRTKRELPPHDKIIKDDFKIFKGVKILIAEDNFINQKVITGLLADSGIEITMANDGQECIDILKQDKDFALILMDAHMPVLDGFQATRYIREHSEYEHLPVIALSGDTATDDIQKMINSGMEDHLEKPLKIDALYDILYLYTDGSESNNKKENKEFDIHQGLEICGGDKEFYLEILNDFLSNYSHSADKIQEYLSKNNSLDADKLLLDISGLAATIGAEQLRNVAIELKQAIASPDDMEYIHSLKDFKRTLLHITELIKEYKSI